ncbi:TetR family transcriptional regulator [Pseudopontixanthobacter vadosimaris]|uniref:TetR family transcriptional regulator n=1 Tax=Pseudopontixanthobacter vadosimaris TaxID=2726450 RepID=UPI0014730637|nr:TetR family transcriptional regulator [Pseudopontixanthobacter vadosimaris]
MNVAALSLPDQHGSKPDIRSSLLQAAGALMRERDTVEIGILDIAKRAGVNHGMIRYYFDNKEGLLLALLERDLLARIDQLDRLLALDITATEQMRRHLGGVVDTFYEIPYLNRLIHYMVRGAKPGRVDHIISTLLEPLVDAQKRIIDKGVATGEFRKVDPRLFFFTITGSADGLYANRLTLQAVFGLGRDAADAELHETYKEHTLDVLMAGLLA